MVPGQGRTSPGGARLAGAALAAPLDLGTERGDMGLGIEGLALGLQWAACWLAGHSGRGCVAGKAAEGRHIWP